MLALPAEAAAPVFTQSGAAARTIAAALAYFRDAILVEAKDEIASGEWIGVAEVDHLITSFTTQGQE